MSGTASVGVRSRWWVDVVVVVVFAVLTVGMTWPVAARLGTHFAGDDVDVWHNHWATWWTEKALMEGRDLYYTRWMFYPAGVSLAFHSFSHVNTLLALVMQPVVGVLAAENITVLLAYVLSGYGMFCLVRHVTGSAVAGVYGGMVFAFYPYRMAEMSHPVVVSTQWMPLYVLSVMRLMEGGRWRQGVVAAVFFVLTALSSWHLMAFTGFLTVMYVGYVGVWERERLRGAVWGLVLAGVVAGGLLAPFLMPLIREQMGAGGAYVGAPVEWAIGNDVVGLFVPAAGNPVLGGLGAGVRAAYVGLSVLGLSVVGGVLDWRRARLWVIVGLVSVVLTLGPRVRVKGEAVGPVLPWSGPVIWLVRHPVRVNVLVGFGVAASGGVGLAALLRRMQGRWWVVAGGAMGLLLVEYMIVPAPTTRAEVPAYYDWLRAEPGEGAVLELPMGRQPSKYYMYYQTIHNRPMVEGLVSRTPEEAYRVVENVAVLRSFRACGANSLPPVDVSEYGRSLADVGIEAVVIHEDFAGGPSRTLWQEAQNGPADYEDGDVVVHQTHSQTARAGDGPWLLEGCVAVRPVIPEFSTVPQGRVLEVPLEWWVGATPQEPYVLELTLAGSGGEIVAWHQYEFAVGTALTAGDRREVSYPFEIAPLISPGRYGLWATLRPTRPETRLLLSQQLLEVELVEASPDAPMAGRMRAAGAVFGNHLALQAYGVDVDAGRQVARLTLDWQCLQAMDVDYKFFVHVYDAVGNIVAQHDAMPPQLDVSDQLVAGRGACLR